MSDKAQVASLYNALFESGGVRQIQYPAAAVGFNLVSDGAAAAGALMAANTEIVAAGVIATPIWIVGITLGIPQVEAFYGDLTIGTGAAGAETEIIRQEVGTALFAVVEWAYPTIFFPAWIKVTGQPRLSFNFRKNTAASAAGFNNCHLVVLTGVGS
jgi:hypothetical protein